MSAPNKLQQGVDGTVATDPYAVPDTLLGSRRPIKVIVIGFGMSGINLSYILGQQIKDSNITLQFYDKNPELGGTWYENKLETPSIHLASYLVKTLLTFRV